MESRKKLSWMIMRKEKAVEMKLVEMRLVSLLVSNSREYFE